MVKSVADIAEVGLGGLTSEHFFEQLDRCVICFYCSLFTFCLLT